MGEVTIEALRLDNERLEITNFLSLEQGSVTLARITALIGPQATGKSIVVKLFYFFRTVVAYYSSEVIEEDFGLKDFKREQLKRFGEIFRGISAERRPFSIEYKVGTLELSITKVAESGSIRLSLGDALEGIGKTLKREYSKYDAAWKLDLGRNSRPPSKYNFQKQHEGARDFFSSLPRTLFVPAARSFYSTISEELFSFLASEERVDPLLAHFGSFYEFAKRRVSGELILSHDAGSTKVVREKIRPVIGGEFFRERSKDYIRTDWGSVPLSSSSSGQQESLPLLVSLFEFPTTGDKAVEGRTLIIIEEPEAHLFPSAQKYVLDLMVERVVATGCSILFTTHSPYVLACLNNHIVRRNAGKIPSDVGFDAYVTRSGRIYNLIDSDGVVDTSIIDEVSGVIANEYMEI